MKEKRTQVVSQFKELKSNVKPLLTMLEDPALGRPGRGDNKQYRDTLLVLAERNHTSSEMIENLYKYAKLQFECGNYGAVEQGGAMGAAEYLPIYRMLSKDPSSDASLSAMWGKLAAEILLEKWEDAIDDLKKLREVIDTRVRPRFFQLITVLLEVISE